MGTAANLGRTLTGAWIETGICTPRQRCTRVAPSRVRGLKQCKSFFLKNHKIVAPSRVRGLKLENAQSL